MADARGRTARPDCDGRIAASPGFPYAQDCKILISFDNAGYLSVNATLLDTARSAAGPESDGAAASARRKELARLTRVRMRSFTVA
jgi:hypothetical protein